MVPPKNQNVLQVLSWPNINKVHAFSWPLVSMNKSEFKYKSWAVPLTWKCMLFHGHWAASVSSQYHHPGWQVDLSQQAGGFILLSTQLHFNLNARLEEGPLSPDLWNGDICGPDVRILRPHTGHQDPNHEANVHIVSELVTQDANTLDQFLMVSLLHQTQITFQHFFESFVTVFAGGDSSQAMILLNTNKVRQAWRLPTPSEPPPIGQTPGWSKHFFESFVTVSAGRWFQSSDDII